MLILRVCIMVRCLSLQWSIKVKNRRRDSMKLLRNILVGLILILVVLVTVRNLIIRAGIEQGIQAITGLKLEIGKLDIGLLAPTVSITELKIYNPAGYPDAVMADVGEIYVHYSPADILKGQVSIKEFRLSLRLLTVVRQPGNQLNLNSLKALQPRGNGPPPKLTIDDLTLNISKIVYKDYAQTPALVKEFNVNLNEHYTGIHGANDLVHLLVLRALAKTTIASLTGFDLNGLKQGLSSTLLNSLQSDNPVKGLLNSIQSQLNL